jgi:hypothetical protein
MMLGDEGSMVKSVLEVWLGGNRSTCSGDGLSVMTLT